MFPLYRMSWAECFFALFGIAFGIWYGWRLARRAKHRPNVLRRVVVVGVNGHILVDIAADELLSMTALYEGQNDLRGVGIIRLGL
jgi:hypothetical protein